VVLEMPLLLLEDFGGVERAHVQAVGKRALELVIEAPGAGDLAMLEHARADRYVASHLGLALRDRANRVSRLEPDVPQRGEEPLDRRGGLVVGG